MKMEREGAGDRYLCWLTEDEYRALVEAAPSEDSRILVRLAGEAGLRPEEMLDVQLGKHEVIDGYHFLQLPNIDTERGPEFRDVYLTDSLYDDLVTYAEAEGRSFDAPLFSFVKRTLQGKIKRAAESLAEEWENDDYEYISSKDLRRFFAKRLLLGDRVHLRVIMELGGWENLNSMDTYLPYPSREELFAELDRVTPVVNDE